VLSGGGSRGAYEAGIIHYLRTDLAKRLGRQVPIDIVMGTSVGAINAAFLAASMDQPAQQVQMLVAAWRALRIEEGRLTWGHEVGARGRRGPARMSCIATTGEPRRGGGRRRRGRRRR
jgi:predicted acylesterase/phospholipase RssA